MLLMMLERKMPVDIILFCDTGLEFPAMYEHINKLEQYIKRPITRIHADESFEYYFRDMPIARRNPTAFIARHGADHHGYGWPDARIRWCTTRLKDMPRTQFLKHLQADYTVIEYVGIAADETRRMQRKNNQSQNHAHPLVDWGITEEQCLQYCYQHGFHWGGLYEIFPRVSCWCCPLQSLAELRTLRLKFPELWTQLLQWDSRTWRKFRADYSAHDLEIRFAFEEECLEKGVPIKGKAFFDALKQKIQVTEASAA